MLKNTICVCMKKKTVGNFTPQKLFKKPTVESTDGFQEVVCRWGWVSERKADVVICRKLSFNVAIRTGVSHFQITTFKLTNGIGPGLPGSVKQRSINKGGYFV